MNIKGYIEGYYGQLLNWNDRKLIINSLNKNNMNTYFYAPKEDYNHRFNWRKKYNLRWRNNFKYFTEFSKKKNIRVIAGIAPGLDFNFKTFIEDKNTFKNHDFKILLNKSRQLIKDGATDIALLLDDIPNNYSKNFSSVVSEGTCHGILANKLSQELKLNIYFVPRIYADELIKETPNYLRDLSKILSKNIKVFYCGKNVVSETIIKHSKINKILSNKIIFWDNYYANDYCPRRFFIGPYLGRRGIKNFMINPTGLINTDLLILDIVKNTINQKTPMKEWIKILNKHKVPFIFHKIKKFFFKPNTNSNLLLQTYKINLDHFDALEFLLWSWKSDLSREWYPYLFGLKQDLQLNQKLLTSERLIKTQTQPLAEFISKLK